MDAKTCEILNRLLAAAEEVNSGYVGHLSQCLVDRQGCGCSCDMITVRKVLSSAIGKTRQHLREDHS